ncbi:MAG: hypothetical protein BWY09_02265 [Candidatus Hydrogenedentes bacterium ADurb.Bin179]|nr:MAG: hypothetical protein BWY09_02265 [Candidatus Hydrogenedentes bacterium ADurb.Bin179]
MQHADHHLFLPHNIDVRQPEPMVFKIERRRIRGDECVHLFLHLFHILIIAAFQLHPKTGIAIIVGDKMADIVGTVAALVGN